MCTFDIVLETSLSPATSSRSSTASTRSSFSIAYTTLATEPRFSYYRSHISTEDEDMYTCNSAYSCNLSAAPFQSLRPMHFGRFYRYIPDLSGEEDDAYTDGVNIMYDTLRGPGQLHIQPEQKVIGKFRQVRYHDPSNELESPPSYIGPKDFAYWLEIEVTEAVDVGVKSSVAGQRLGSSVDVSTISMRVRERRRDRLRRETHKRAKSLAEMSEKVKEILRKMHMVRR
jgi:hypothetical protein